MNDTNTRRIALFLDAENINKSEDLENILAYLEADGNEVRIKRAYADWTKPTMKELCEYLKLNPMIRTLQTFHYGETTNQKGVGQDADQAIVMDAIELVAKNKDINTICIASSDKGYCALTARLQEYGIEVWGIGYKNASDLWQKACNKFELIKNIRPSRPVDSFNEDSEIPISELISAAYEKAKKNDEGWALLSTIGDYIHKKAPEYKRPKGCKNWIELVRTTEEYEVETDGRTPPTYSIKPKSDNFKHSHGSIKKRIKNYGFVESKETKMEYFFSFAAIDEESRSKKIKVGAPVEFDIVKEPNPKATESRVKNGKAINIKLL